MYSLLHLKMLQKGFVSTRPFPCRDATNEPRVRVRVRVRVSAGMQRMSIGKEWRRTRLG